MKSLTTWLASSVESMLPSTLAAACVTGSDCQTEVIVNGGKIETYHRTCLISCHGKPTGHCTAWSPGGC
jgi:hypothetical protein